MDTRNAGALRARYAILPSAPDRGKRRADKDCAAALLVTPARSRDRGRNSVEEKLARAGRPEREPKDFSRLPLGLRLCGDDEFVCAKNS